MLRGLRTLIARRPKLAAALLILLLAAAGYGYALWNWWTAQVALQEGRAAQAKDRLGFCLTVWPRSVSVHLAAARAARLNGEFAAAEDHLGRCLKLQRGASDAIQFEFFLLRVQLGEVDEVAPGLWTCVNNKHPESVLILETLTRAYVHNHRYRPALGCLDRWIQIEPTSARPHDWRGWIMERINNVPEALNEYRTALSLNPDLPTVRLKVAEILLGQTNVPEALPHLERLRNEFPDRPDVLARLGQCRFMEGKHDEARALLEAAQGKIPNDALLLIHLARLDLHDGRQPERAEALLRRVLKEDPADVEAQYTLISALQLQGRSAEATLAADHYQKTRALLERANRLLKDEAHSPSQDAAPAAELGASLLGIGQERLGLYWLHQALARSPGHAPAHEALAAHYESKGEANQAAAHRKRLAGPAKKTSP